MFPFKKEVYYRYTPISDMSRLQESSRHKYPTVAERINQCNRDTKSLSIIIIDEKLATFPRNTLE